jgi:outer membrane protein TolC
MRTWRVLGLVVVLASLASAEPAAPRVPAVTSPLRLTPDAAAALAVERSIDVALSEEQVNTARGFYRHVRAQKGLLVDGTVTGTYSGPPQTIDLPTGPVDLVPPFAHRESLQVTLPLWLGGREAPAKRGARANIEAAQHNVHASEVQSAYLARQAVYGVLRLQQLVVVVQQRVTAIAEHLRIARAMFEAGTVARFEVVQAETVLSRVKGEAIHAATAVSQQQAALLQALNVEQGTEVLVEEGVPPKLPDGDRYQLMALALEQRPEIAALQAAVRARQGALRVAHLYDAASLGLQGHVNNASATVFNEPLTWDLAVAVTKPFYQGGEKEAQVMQAKAALQTARLNLERGEQSIALQVTDAQLGVDDAQAALGVAEQGEVEARERLRIAQVRFANGVSLGVEVLDAQTALAAAQTQVINARYDLQVATIALRAALGLADLPKEPS